MAIVIDASVALKWVVEEDGSAEAAELISESLIAPALWIIECANVLCSLVRRGEIDDDDAKRKLADLQDSHVVRSSIEQDIDAAMAMALTLKHPIYDCFYLALAVREGAQVVTADERFYGAVERSGAFPNAVRMLTN